MPAGQRGGTGGVRQCTGRAKTSGLNNARGSTAYLVRSITVDGDAVHDPALAMVIVDRVVLDAAIVPKGDCVSAPAETAGEFGPHRSEEHTSESSHEIPSRMPSSA